MLKSDAKDRKGFALIELMIVVGIIGLLAAIAVPSFQSYLLESYRAEVPENLNAYVEGEMSHYSIGIHTTSSSSNLKDQDVQCFLDFNPQSNGSSIPGPFEPDAASKVLGVTISGSVRYKYNGTFGPEWGPFEPTIESQTYLNCAVDSTFGEGVYGNWSNQFDVGAWAYFHPDQPARVDVFWRSLWIGPDGGVTTSPAGYLDFNPTPPAASSSPSSPP